MTRLVMGNKPSANYSIIAVKETAKLGNSQFDFPIAYQALTEDSYVDNVFLVASDHHEIAKGITEVDQVAKGGGFFFKE